MPRDQLRHAPRRRGAVRTLLRAECEDKAHRKLQGVRAHGVARAHLEGAQRLRLELAEELPHLEQLGRHGTALLGDQRERRPVERGERLHRPLHHRRALVAQERLERLEEERQELRLGLTHLFDRASTGSPVARLQTELLEARVARDKRLEGLGLHHGGGCFSDGSAQRREPRGTGRRLAAWGGLQRTAE